MTQQLIRCPQHSAATLCSEWNEYTLHYILLRHFFKISFNISLLSTCSSSKWFLSFRHFHYTSLVSATLTFATSVHWYHTQSLCCDVHRTQCVSIKKATQWMLYREAFAVCCEGHLHGMGKRSISMFKQAGHRVTTTLNWVATTGTFTYKWHTEVCPARNYNSELCMS